MDKYRILVKGIVKMDNKYLILAVLRLISELAGVTATVDRPLYTWTFKTGDTFNIGISYLCIASTEAVVLSEDIVDSKWIGKREFKQYIDGRVLKDVERVEL